MLKIAIYNIIKNLKNSLFYIVKIILYILRIWVIIRVQVSKIEKFSNLFFSKKINIFGHVWRILENFLFFCLKICLKIVFGKNGHFTPKMHIFQFWVIISESKISKYSILIIHKLLQRWEIFFCELSQLYSLNYSHLFI